MALKDLKSDLSWYGKKAPGPYKPNTNVKDTKYTNDKGIPGATVSGYSPSGVDVVSYRQVAAGNSFSINPLDSTKGLSTRTAQLGAGSPFLKDMGWHGEAKYSDSVKRLDWDDDKAKLKSGLAFRYTANSPIDDQYNKFKFRDEAFNRMPYAREPFILRGIQRDGKTKNRRWGADKYAIDDGLVRGGIVTASHRIAVDALRLGKWLIKPKGIMWMVKQLGLQMSNPNTESAAGVVAPPFANTKKIFTPINLLANVIGAPLGERFQRHGIIPLPTTSRYEDVTGTLRPTALAKKEANRLNLLLKELQPSAVNGLPATGGPAGLLGGKLGALLKKIGGLLGFAGQGINTLSGMTGPGSLYGIGNTQIRRAVDTSYDAQIAGRDKGLDGLGLGIAKKYWFHTAEIPYFPKPLTKEQEDTGLRDKAKDSLKSLYGIGPLPNSLLSGLGLNGIVNRSGITSKEAFHLSGLQAQLGAHTDNKFQDGTGEGITKKSYDETLTSKSKPYLGTNQEGGVIVPGSIKNKENEKDKDYWQKQVKRFEKEEESEEGFKLTGLDAQLASHVDNKIKDGSTDGITKDLLEKKTSTTEDQYGVDNKDGTTFAAREDNLRKTAEDSLKKIHTDTTYPVTGLDNQLTSHDGNIPGIGDKASFTEKRKVPTNEDAYFGSTIPYKTSVKKPIEGETPDKREDNLQKEVEKGKKLKDQDNYWSKGVDASTTDGSTTSTGNIGAGSTVQNIPDRANTDDSTPAGKNIKTVQHYAAMAYGNLQVAAKARAEGLTEMVDFREPILQNNPAAKNFIGKVIDDKGKESTYSAENREVKYNERALGKGGRDRSNRLKNNVPDKISAAGFNIGKRNPDPNIKDFINFKFYPIDMGKRLSSATSPILFRAYIDSLSDSISPSWGENNDQGRADAKIMLEDRKSVV